MNAEWSIVEQVVKRKRRVVLGNKTNETVAEIQGKEFHSPKS